MRRPLGITITDTTHYIKGVRLFDRPFGSFVRWGGAAAAADVPADCNNHLDLLSPPLPSPDPPDQT